MGVHNEAKRIDAFLARLQRLSPDLRSEEARGDFAAVASYIAEDGSRIFTFCINGLLLDPDGDARFISYSEIEDTTYHGIEELKQEKSGQMSSTLGLNLQDGESLALPLKKSTGRFSERLRIGKLVEQRVRLANANQK